MSVQFKYKGLVRMELIDTDTDMTSDEQLSVQVRTVNYIDHYLKNDDFNTDHIGADTKSVFLLRFVTSYAM